MKTNNYIILGLLALGFMACEMRDELKKLPSKEDQQEEGLLWMWFLTVRIKRQRLLLIQKMWMRLCIRSKLLI